MIKQPVRFFEDVVTGELLPTLEVTIDLTALVMYAGATWDFHRYHYDKDLVAGLGMPAPFMDGQMLGALIGRLLMQWGGRDAFVRRLSYLQRATVFAGDTIRVSGRVSGSMIDAGRPLALCTLNITSASGTVIARDIAAAVELARRPT